MQNQNKINAIIEQLIVSPLEKELQTIVQSIQYVSERYSFLFENDNIRTKDVIVGALIKPQQKLLNAEGKFKLDADKFLALIEDPVKEEIFDALISKFSESTDVEELRKMTSIAKGVETDENSSSDSK